MPTQEADAEVSVVGVVVRGAVGGLEVEERFMFAFNSQPGIMTSQGNSSMLLTVMHLAERIVFLRTLDFTFGIFYLKCSN